MTRGRYYLLWFEMLVRGVATLVILAALLEWTLTGDVNFASPDFLFWLMINIPMLVFVMLPFAVNFVVTGRWNFIRCVMLTMFLGMIIPSVKIVGGLVGAIRGEWWPDMILLLSYLAGGMMHGILSGTLFWGLGALFPWNWRVTAKA